MNRRDVQEVLVPIASGDLADTELAELTIVPPKKEVTILSISSLMDAAGAGSSSVHVATEAAPTVALVEAATTGGAGTLTSNSVATRGYTYCNTGATTVKLVVATGSVAPGQNGTAIVRFSIASLPE